MMKNEMSPTPDVLSRFDIVVLLARDAMDDTKRNPGDSHDAFDEENLQNYLGKKEDTRRSRSRWWRGKLTFRHPTTVPIGPPEMSAPARSPPLIKLRLS